jgi:iron-sulfur cluster assembly protein
VLTISDIASEKIREVLGQSEKSNAALRVFVRGMACSGPAYGMALHDETRPDDRVEDLGGLRVLVDPQSAPYLDGAEIDYVDSLMGQGFSIVNPNYTKEASGEGGGGGCGGGCSCGR